LALGIDIGGTNTAFGIVNRRGEIVSKGSMPTTGYPTVHEYIGALTDSIRPLLEAVGHDQVQGAGIGAPNGNIFTGEIVFAPNLPWKGVTIPLVKLLTESLHLKCTLTTMPMRQQ